jgi:SAM-dependent methyltransferase
MSDRSDYYHYFTFGWESYVSGLLLRIREEVFQRFVTAFRPAPAQTVLDVGVSADDHPSSNHLEKRYPHAERICGLSVDHFPELRSQFSGMTLVQGDARALPFADGSFDFVYSHAVIEHVGSRVQQARFLEEALRVARCGIFVTTPNRWHPVETHTGLPFLHFLPAPLYHWLYRLLGKGMYASEQTLHLMGARTLRRLVREVRPKGAIVRLWHVRWLSLTSNLVLLVSKEPHDFTTTRRRWS